jgi:hypothetical protein
MQECNGEHPAEVIGHFINELIAAEAAQATQAPQAQIVYNG